MAGSFLFAGLQVHAGLAAKPGLIVCLAWSDEAG